MGGRDERLVRGVVVASVGCLLASCQGASGVGSPIPQTSAATTPSAAVLLDTLAVLKPRSAADDVATTASLIKSRAASVPGVALRVFILGGTSIEVHFHVTGGVDPDQLLTELVADPAAVQIQSLATVRPIAGDRSPAILAGPLPSGVVFEAVSKVSGGVDRVRDRLRASGAQLTLVGQNEIQIWVPGLAGGPNNASSEYELPLRDEAGAAIQDIAVYRYVEV